MSKQTDNNSDNNSEHNYYKGKPSLSPIPLHVSSAPIKAVDKGKLRATAVESMYLQAEQQMSMLRKQAETLMQQAKEIEQRLEVSKLIYEADMGFKPVPLQIYHLYQKEDKMFLSMIAPSEWGHKSAQIEFKATVRLLSDQTWEVISQNKKGGL